MLSLLGRYYIALEGMLHGQHLAMFWLLDIAGNLYLAGILGY